MTGSSWNRGRMLELNVVLLHVTTSTKRLQIGEASHFVEIWETKIVGIPSVMDLDCRTNTTRFTNSSSTKQNKLSNPLPSLGFLIFLVICFVFLPILAPLLYFAVPLIERRCNFTGDRM